MERKQFDRITRRLTTGTSRRGAVSGVLAGVTALLMSADPLKAKQGSNGKGQEKTSGNGKAKNTAKAK